jgi:hypothetical protein
VQCPRVSCHWWIFKNNTRSNENFKLEEPDPLSHAHSCSSSGTDNPENHWKPFYISILLLIHLLLQEISVDVAIALWVHLLHQQYTPGIWEASECPTWLWWRLSFCVGRPPQDPKWLKSLLSCSTSVYQHIYMWQAFLHCYEIKYMSEKAVWLSGSYVQVLSRYECTVTLLTPLTHHPQKKIPVFPSNFLFLGFSSTLGIVLGGRFTKTVSQLFHMHCHA